MIRTLEGVIDKDGVVRLLQPIPLEGARRALVTILDEEPGVYPNETALLSETALAEARTASSDIGEDGTAMGDQFPPARSDAIAIVSWSPVK